MPPFVICLQLTEYFSTLRKRSHVFIFGRFVVPQLFCLCCYVYKRFCFCLFVSESFHLSVWKFQILFFICWKRWKHQKFLTMFPSAVPQELFFDLHFVLGFLNIDECVSVIPWTFYTCNTFYLWIVVEYMYVEGR
jgi:hypothetical protein